MLLSVMGLVQNDWELGARVPPDHDILVVVGLVVGYRLRLRVTLPVNSQPYF
jgi:hypothetical protein